MVLFLFVIFILRIKTNMKSIAEFKKETSEHTMVIRELCKQELTAMKNSFCKNEFVNLLVPKRPTDEYYFEYNVFPTTFWIAFGDGGYRVCAVRHYIYEDEWTLMVKSQNGTYDEVCASQLKASDLIELVSLLKRELFNY
jgi:hypothetical protein